MEPVESFQHEPKSRGKWESPASTTGSAVANCPWHSVVPTPIAHEVSFWHGTTAWFRYVENSRCCRNPLSNPLEWVRHVRSRRLAWSGDQWFHPKAFDSVFDVNWPTSHVAWTFVHGTASSPSDCRSNSGRKSHVETFRMDGELSSKVCTSGSQSDP